MIIAVDFDGTIVEHAFPEIGKELPGAFDALKMMKEAGHKLILWTCRNDEDSYLDGRKVLTEAVDFCRENGVEFDAVNENLKELSFQPYPKIYADLYIDDRAVEFAAWNEVNIDRIITCHT